MYRKIGGQVLNNSNAFIWIVFFMILFTYNVRAQSLGDPIVDITFGSGSATNAGALAPDSGSTTYSYSNGAPNDGYYTIANSTAGMRPGWWATTDHTGNPGGYMMVVNGSYDPGIFYTRTVSGLCSNTTYQFAAWIKNILNYNGILPNVSFSIETTNGTILGSGTTGNIPTGNTWIQYPFTFTTPAGTESVIIKMTNNAPGGLGNDIVIDDITFRPYGAPVTAVFNQSATAQVLCAGVSQKIDIKATTTLAAGYVQKLQQLVNGTWTDQSPASNVLSYTVVSPVAAGTYNYRIVSGLAGNVSSSACVVSSNLLTLTVVARPTAEFSAANTTCLEDSTYFKDQSASPATIVGWLWDFGDGRTSTLQNPSHKFPQAAIYTVSLTATSALGCSATTTKNYTVNSAIPVAGFTVSNPSTLCSNREVLFTNQSTVDFGNITRVQWYFDYGNHPSVVETDNNPFYGKVYRHSYPPFYLPAQASFQVRMLAYSGSSCVSVLDKTITLLATPQLSFTAPEAICLNAGLVQLSAGAVNGVAGSGLYSGQGISTSGLFNPAVAGVGTFPIQYIFISGNSCTDTVIRHITVNPPPAVSAGPAMVVLEGGNATLKATASGDSLTYAWSPATGLSSNNILNPVVTPTADITYTLIVTSNKGCSASSQVTVSVLKAPVVPNTFTPNGDGINDNWDIKYLDAYPDCMVEVFNRYGSRVYLSTGYTAAWDGRYNGKDLPIGAYYYIINPKRNRKVISGSVTIIR